MFLFLNLRYRVKGLEGMNVIANSFFKSLILMISPTAIFLGSKLSNSNQLLVIETDHT